jgi:hypothetical protein
MRPVDADEHPRILCPRQRPRYLAATRREKRCLLDEVVAVTGSHRKATLGRLHRPPRSTPRAARTGRPRVYGPDVTLGALHAMPATAAVLRRVRVATLKRLLAPVRTTRLPSERGMTCAGTRLKLQVPIRTLAECRQDERATTGRRGRQAPCPDRASQ